MKQQDLQLLLEKYKAGKCTAAEVTLLFAWLDKTAAATPEAGLSSEAAQSVQDAVWQHISKKPAAKRRHLGLWMAAATLLPFFICLLTWQQHSRQPPQMAAVSRLISRTGPTETRRVLLPDGSVAQLNASSSLEYPAQFTGHERCVSIKGQVFLDIKHQPQQPFVALSGDLRITVLGTSFLVRNIPGQPAKVAVASGKVQVAHQQQVLATLRPSDMLTYTDKRTFISSTDTTTINAWIRGEQLLSGATLQQVLWELEAYHGVTFSSRLPLQQGRLDLSFSSNMTLQDKLDIIATISVAPKVHFRETGKGTYEVY
ncbi:FecR family protein [Chitinophaga solisilvae]|uniref:FecR family protein n=1 Tax=Chitinophaga solisilvae TaxID=1233460 RepID=UPI0013705F7C|nr:FecR domain-containing protein [Chitinophaga solisilvae]